MSKAAAMPGSFHRLFMFPIPSLPSPDLIGWQKVKPGQGSVLSFFGGGRGKS
jgi:hypothetical protein